MRALIFKDKNFLLAQGIDEDICVQVDLDSVLNKPFQLLLHHYFLNRELNKDYSNLTEKIPEIFLQKFNESEIEIYQSMNIDTIFKLCEDTTWEDFSQ